MKEWIVRFNRSSKLGKEISFEKRFARGGKTHIIPSVYQCKEGWIALQCRLRKYDAAALSIRFKVPETVIWEVVFRMKTVEDLKISLI